jgi:hypothetical protein
MKSILAAIILSFLVPSVVQADEKTDLQKMQGGMEIQIGDAGRQRGS